MLSCSKKKPIRYKKLKPQTAIAISLWFWGLLTSPEFYCDWSDWPVRIKSKCSLFFDCTVNQIESLIVLHFNFTSMDLKWRSKAWHWRSLLSGILSKLAIAPNFLWHDSFADFQRMLLHCSAASPHNYTSLFHLLNSVHWGANNY